MKPTPEQVAAAKAWTKDFCSVEQYRQIRAYKPMLESAGDVSGNVSLILLAVLEAAEAQIAADAKYISDRLDNIEQASRRIAELEADSARLDWLEERKGMNDGNCDIRSESLYVMHVPSGHDYYEGGKNLPLREAIDAARKAQP